MLEEVHREGAAPICHDRPLQKEKRSGHEGVCTLLGVFKDWSFKSRERVLGPSSHRDVLGNEFGGSFIGVTLARIAIILSEKKDWQK